MKKKRTYKPYHYLIIIFLGGLSVVILYPLVWMLMTSFKTNVDIRTNRAKFFPTEWTLEGYRTAFEKAPIANWFINSILITVIITLAVIVTSTLMGYVFAKYEFRFKRTLFVLLLGDHDGAAAGDDDSKISDDPEAPSFRYEGGR